MSLPRGVLSLIVVCSILVILAVLGLFFDFSSLMEFHPNIDGLLLLAVCLMMGGIFALMLFSLAKEEGWLAHLPVFRKKAAAPAQSQPANPAPAASANPGRAAEKSK